MGVDIEDIIRDLKQIHGQDHILNGAYTLYEDHHWFINDEYVTEEEWQVRQNLKMIIE